MKGNLFKIANVVRIPFLLRKIKGADITVLSLHRISEERDFFFEPILPGTFASLVEYCVKHYEITTFSEIHRKTSKPKLILSFDDGYYDFMEHVVPTLQKYGVPCNHNLVNDCLNGRSLIWTQKLNDIFLVLRANNIIDDEIVNRIGNAFDNNWLGYHFSFLQGLLKIQKTERDKILDNLSQKYNVKSSYKMMDWNDAKMCIEKFNVEIGSHTYNHESLLMMRDDESMNREIGNSIAELEMKLDTKINILALPNGQYNSDILDYAEKRGINFVLKVNDTLTKSRNLNHGFNLINRINLVNEPIEEMILRTECFHSRIRKMI